MNRTKLAVDILKACMGGASQQFVFASLGDCGKRIRQLEKNGFIRSEPIRSGRAGRPGLMLYTIKQWPLEVPPQLIPRGASLQTAILNAIGNEELRLAEIAVRVARNTECISGTLLRMCSAGQLVRRHMPGIRAGYANSCVWYVYRRP